MILLIFISVIISFLLTGFIYKYYKKHNFIDIPEGRNLHDQPVVTGGGISIVVLNIFGLIYYNISIIFIIPIILISILGFIDDKINLHPLIRILFHFLCSYFIIIWIEGFPILDFGLFIIDNIYIRNILGIIFISWFINLYNFMDGSDGFATLESIFISLSLLVIINLLLINLVQNDSLFIYPLLLINSGACMGFLFLNYPNARIFMGDQGSVFLGLYLISISLYIVNSSIVSIWTILILYGLFFIDATITLFRRFLYGQKWYLPHRSHWYQRFIIYKQKTISRKGAHQKLLIYSSLINYLWLLPMSIFSVILAEYSFLIFLLSSMPLIYLSLYKYNEEFEV